MPRRSAADISVMSLVPGKGRPEPPKELSLAERRAWNDTVDALPGQWLDPAGQLVLRRIAAEVAVAERLEVRLRRLSEMEDTAETLEAEKMLAGMHRETTRTIMHALGALRATPRSRMTAREGRSRFERSVVSSRPWDIVARKADDPAS